MFLFLRQVTSRLSAVNTLPMSRMLDHGARYVRDHYSSWAQQEGGYVRQTHTSLKQSALWSLFQTNADIFSSFAGGSFSQWRRGWRWSPLKWKKWWNLPLRSFSFTRFLQSDMKWRALASHRLHTAPVHMCHLWNHSYRVVTGASRALHLSESANSLYMHMKWDLMSINASVCIIRILKRDADDWRLICWRLSGTQSQINSSLCQWTTGMWF